MYNEKYVDLLIQQTVVEGDLYTIRSIVTAIDGAEKQVWVDLYRQQYEKYERINKELDALVGPRLPLPPTQWTKTEEDSVIT